MSAIAEGEERFETRHSTKTVEDEVHTTAHGDEGQDGEPCITVINDVLSYFTSRLPKYKDAIWVRGLSQKDEEEAIEQLRLEEFRKQHALMPRFYVIPLGRDWLMLPNALGILFILTTLYTMCFLPPEVLDDMSLGMEYNTLRQLLRRRGEGTVGCISRTMSTIITLPSLMAFVYAFALSARVGLSTHQFSALCGVGTAALYLIGIAAQYSIVFQGRGYLDSKPEDTDIELFMYVFTISSALKILAPLISLFLVCRTVILAMPVKNTATQIMRFLIILPVFFALPLALESVLHTDIPRSTYAVYACTCFTWSVFLWTCVKQKNFEIPVVNLPETCENRS